MASAGLMLCGPCLPWMTMVGAFLMHVMIKQLQCVLDSFQMTGSRPWLVSSFREGSKKKKKNPERLYGFCKVQNARSSCGQGLVGFKHF